MDTDRNGQRIKRYTEWPKAIVERRRECIDIDLRAYFDNVRHHLLLEKVARRVDDEAVMHLLKMMLKATGKKGVPQGGVISPLLSNIYLTEVDRDAGKSDHDNPSWAIHSGSIRAFRG